MLCSFPSRARTLVAVLAVGGFAGGLLAGGRPRDGHLSLASRVTLSSCSCVGAPLPVCVFVLVPGPLEGGAGGGCGVGVVAAAAGGALGEGLDLVVDGHVGRTGRREKEWGKSLAEEAILCLLVYSLVAHNWLVKF